MPVPKISEAVLKIEERPSLATTRWLVYPVGFVCAALCTWLLLLFDFAVRFLGFRVREVFKGKPLHGLTEWCFDTVKRIDDGHTILAIAAGAFLCFYLPLFLTIHRSGNVAFIGLRFAIWLGLLLSFVPLAGSIVAPSFLLPFVPIVSPMQAP